MTIEQMKNVDINTVDIDTLADAKDVYVDMELPKVDRMINIKKQLGNLYCFRSGIIAVKIKHANTTITIDDRVENIIATY